MGTQCQNIAILLRHHQSDIGVPGVVVNEIPLRSWKFRLFINVVSIEGYVGGQEGGCVGGSILKVIHLW